MPDIFGSLSSSAHQRLVKSAQPTWLDPMLATLTDRYFSDDDWIYERKLDGERCLVFRSGSVLRLMSRNQKKLNIHYPDLEQQLSALEPQHFIIDGEIVAFRGEQTSFSLLQQRMQVQDKEAALASDIKVYYYIFDLLYFEGYDTTQLSQRDRKTLLQHALEYTGQLCYVEHRNKEGVDYFKEACKLGWEGVIAKDARSPYIHGRSRNWLKFKCINEQELVIAGFTDPHGKRIGFGALLLGYYEGGTLRYAGKVGTGFDEKTLRQLHDKLVALEQDSPAFESVDVPSAEVHWVKPELVAEIGFEEWTKNNLLRQPRFLGMRDDKSAADVVKETPEE
ncbi:MAG: non-homologous end-joining DNA ligase [Candidatus Promineifilaceae bacterium]|jgi:DNA ligase D-like protein (predicted ligase)